jgi:hypothetical protein
LADSLLAFADFCLPLVEVGVVLLVGLLAVLLVHH